MIFSDEILREMVRLTEEQNQPLEKEAGPELQMDPSQFAFIETPTDEIGVASVPLIENVVLAVDYDGQDKELLKEKKRALTLEDIVEQAHPEPAFMADGPYGTGVVENQNEQHTKILNTIYKMPTGFHFNTFADLVEGLNKLATHLDEKGDTEAAQKADETLRFFFHKRADISKEVAPTSGPKHPLTQDMLAKEKAREMRGRTPAAPQTFTHGPAATEPLHRQVTDRSTGQPRVQPATKVVSLPPGEPVRTTYGPKATEPLHRQVADKPTGKPRKQPPIKHMPLDEKDKPKKTPEPKPEKDKPEAKKPKADTAKPKADTAKPKGKAKTPIGPRAKEILMGLGGWLKNLGKAGKAGIAAAVIAGIYGLWQALKDDWDKAIADAQEAAKNTNNEQAKSLVSQLEKLGQGIKSQGKELDEVDTQVFGQLKQLADQLATMAPNISPEMVDAVGRINKILNDLAEDVEGFVHKAAPVGPDPERVSSLQSWFKERDPNMHVDGNVDDPRLRKHVEKFLGNVRKKFSRGPGGAKFLDLTRDTLTTNNVLNNFDYDHIDQLFQIFANPRSVLGETKREEKAPIKV